MLTTAFNIQTKVIVGYRDFRMINAEKIIEWSMGRGCTIQGHCGEERRGLKIAHKDKSEARGNQAIKETELELSGNKKRMSHKASRK